MEVDPDAIIYGLLEEIKRLTLENVALKAMAMKANHETSQPDDDEVA